MNSRNFGHVFGHWRCLLALRHVHVDKANWGPFRIKMDPNLVLKHTVWLSIYASCYLLFNFTYLKYVLCTEENSQSNSYLTCTKCKPRDPKQKKKSKQPKNEEKNLTRIFSKHGIHTCVNVKKSKCCLKKKLH